MDFQATPFFDNPTHRIDVSDRSITPLDLAVAFIHGWGPINDEHKPLGSSAEVENCTPEYADHVLNTGVFKALVFQLANFFGCTAAPEAVVEARNKCVHHLGGQAYAKLLYDDVHMLAEVADDGAPMNDSALQCFPTRLLRLFQMDPAIRALLHQTSSFAELKQEFSGLVREKIREGFIGLKSHVLEVLNGPPYTVEDADAEDVFCKAKAGDSQAFGRVYLGLFQQALILAQEMSFTVHVHTGCTGNAGNDVHGDKSLADKMQVYSNDPYLLCPFLKDHRFYAAPIVLLHGDFPDIRRAALMTHAFPNVYMDLGWTLPWVALDADRCIEEALGIAPHDKILLGTGQHNYPEMSWLAARVAKQALGRVMDSYVVRGLLSTAQARETGEQLLYRNAMHLYRLESKEKENS